MATSLKVIREKFNRVKTQISEKTGRRAGLMERLEQEQGITSIEEIYTRLEGLQNEIAAKKTAKDDLIRQIDQMLLTVEA